MVWVKFESIYTETDRHGNMRRWENRFEAIGSASEVCLVLNTVMNRVRLPGTSPIGQLGRGEDDLLSNYGSSFRLPHSQKANPRTEAR